MKGLVSGTLLMFMQPRANRGRLVPLCGRIPGASCFQTSASVWPCVGLPTEQAGILARIPPLELSRSNPALLPPSILLGPRWRNGRPLCDVGVWGHHASSLGRHCETRGRSVLVSSGITRSQRPQVSPGVEHDRYGGPDRSLAWVESPRHASEAVTSGAQPRPKERMFLERLYPGEELLWIVYDSRSMRGTAKVSRQRRVTGRCWFGFGTGTGPDPRPERQVLRNQLVFSASHLHLGRCDSLHPWDSTRPA